MAAATLEKLASTWQAIPAGATWLDPDRTGGCLISGPRPLRELDDFWNHVSSLDLGDDDWLLGPTAQNPSDSKAAGKNEHKEDGKLPHGPGRLGLRLALPPKGRVTSCWKLATLATARTLSLNMATHHDTAPVGW